MSNLISPAAVATLSSATRKAFAAVPLADKARGQIYRDGTTDNTSVVPSDLRMTTASAASSLGAKMTPHSFLDGLIYACARHAHGNQFPVETLPPGSKIAIAAACSTLPRGKGCTASMLLAAVEAGIAALLALPAPTARSKPAIAAPTVSLTPAAVDAAPAPAPAPAPAVDVYVDGPIGAEADGAIAEAAANAAQDARIARDAKALADAAQAAELRAAQAAKFAADSKMAASAIVTTICGRADAEAVLRQLAQELGFTLRKAALRKAA